MYKTIYDFSYDVTAYYDNSPALTLLDLYLYSGMVFEFSDGHLLTIIFE
ncbi:hypothetical protein [Sedimentibacter sp.]|nr:hypothetical protein [Sedimentibacter sp.]